MKTALFSSLKVRHGVALARVVSVTASMLAAAIFAAPAGALAASSTTDSASGKSAVTKKAQKSTKKASAKQAVRAEKTAAITEERSRKKRVTYTVRGRHGHNGVRKVAFAPRSPVAGQPFGLQDSPEGLVLRSNVAYVVDQNSAEALFDKNSRAVVPIASITKLMTAMVVLDANLPLTDQLEVTDADRDYEKHTGSRLAVGSVLSREDMLHIALMASENRAAAALSRYYPGGRDAFIAAMNAKARTLGMTDTHFENPTGLTSRNVSTARDLVKMVDAAYQYPLIRRFSTDRSYTVDTGRRELAYNSTNALVRNSSWEIGLQKTGFINEAGECLVMQATIQNRPIIMVLLDSAGKYSRFADAARLRTWIDNGGGERITSADAGGRGT
ncbi:D-alanyl-D-alanine endopeptidase [Trinickia caryophylli]|uniref:Murein-DD-endopeptidase. Serine peptidase. MEROPS family S11 n=1 Tax=Trinickia caryophylli TaxID=28094 RepID=A0A1X7DF00_TRICW|nr:D-alanyl-D-alanine endopeptidase [Trinickia caryophylli]PMS08867.1 D-alanyl-D-alanine endopeptidase [Trinickia caryophylli]TRX16892.1 D-alanyl-D-alanine endopeptidase [Trinickia caryophylli]WQE12377.1 D-alanyl-D-alanine endopeptidase [Trinickia caryophylli]SMF14356.1 murein-DD-endopeptidase. Serine peptidase. MEROPS family S11 [Trinickia caryophylli]GLU31475.1 D-alanyl-D-alanine endopeptidase [Trinickia caryophylli]